MMDIITIMDKKIFIKFSVLICILIAMYFTYLKYNPYKLDITNAKTTFLLNSNTIVNSFLNDEKIANQKYIDQVILINGVVKTTTFTHNRNTITLKGSQNSHTICDLQKNQPPNIQTLNTGDSVKIKGICKGFLKDVILLNCILINNPSNE